MAPRNAKAKAVAGPDTESSDYEIMRPYWDQVRTMLAGVDPMREAGETYLPRFPAESDDNYEYRKANAKFTNIFRDIVENLAAKPFAKETTLKDDDGNSQAVKDFVEDVDGRGNNLNVFAASTFFNGIANAVDWIMVEFPKTKPGSTIADDKRSNVRPYWVRVAAENMLAVYSDIVDGEEQIVHARMYEPTVERDGFGEVEVIRVRVLNRERIDLDDGTREYLPATFTLFERKDVVNARTGRVIKTVWEVVEEGPITIGRIALVPFVTGQRECGSWVIRPPMKDAADLQIEHYQADTNLKMAKEQTAFPMLGAHGISPTKGKNNEPEQLKVGPAAVLYAPMGPDGKFGEYKVIEPSATSLKFLAEDLKEIGQQLRELGRQPLTAQSGNLTVVTTQFAAQKGNSACQKWGHGLKDALERALAYTCEWLNDSSEPEVSVYTDFAIEDADGKSMDQVISMRKNRDLDQRTLWEEGKRRGVLSADFDADETEKRLLEEGPDPLEQAALAGGNIRPGPGGPRPPERPRIAA